VGEGLGHVPGSDCVAQSRVEQRFS
jgi:hypothetical protein